MKARIGPRFQGFGIVMIIGLILFLLIMPILATGWGAHPKQMLLPDSQNVSKVVTVPSYGLFDPDKRNPNVIYRIPGRVIFWSVIFCETIYVPIILLGKYLHEPVAVKAWSKG